MFILIFLIDRVLTRSQRQFKRLKRANQDEDSRSRGLNDMFSDEEEGGSSHRQPENSHLPVNLMISLRRTSFPTKSKFKKMKAEEDTFPSLPEGLQLWLLNTRVLMRINFKNF